ncbi:MAG: hypothetical protein WCS94_02605 [Verrucomicrobiota bacterium]
MAPPILARAERNTFSFRPRASFVTVSAMPSLEFTGKSFIYTHHLGVPYRELAMDVKKSLPA